MMKDARGQDFGYLLELPLGELMSRAALQRDAAFGSTISYSKKVFIPLTQLCRNVCHYCTFAKAPKKLARPFLLPADVLKIAEEGESAGCKEALFTLGDAPEKRYRTARDALASLGYSTTVEYVIAMAKLVHERTGLLPHINAGILTPSQLTSVRHVAPSMGLMLESASERLCSKGMPHYGSPDKMPEKRLDVLRSAGQQRIPTTSGILIGIGETRSERLDSLIALLNLHQKFGHIQEIIVQNFRAKPDTKMAAVADAPIDELLWSIAAARVVFGGEMSIQAPPNLAPNAIEDLIRAGINDLGGISPITPDHVNPERPWPELEVLSMQLKNMGRTLSERLTVYPYYIAKANTWLDPSFTTALLHLVDGSGIVRTDDWECGVTRKPPIETLRLIDKAETRETAIGDVLERSLDGQRPSHSETVRLFSARGDEFTAVCRAANAMRRSLVGDDVTFAVNRNINYTNMCTFHCGFCAFSKSNRRRPGADPAYNISIRELARRVKEAWARGATEVCLQGGIHPSYTGDTYLEVVTAVKQAAPEIHVHAFSPLEIVHGATTLNASIEEYLVRLKGAGLNTLPGTAAEILDDEVRAIICPDKLNTNTWLEVMETAHRVGLGSTSTIMFGHVDTAVHWATHLDAIARLQQRTHGISEFVPLPFVPAETPIFRRGNARPGPTFRETVLMHAIARLVFGDALINIQVSWVKLGLEGAIACLQAGANDVGGTLMNESISRAAGASHGQELDVPALELLLSAKGRSLVQRDTLYRRVSEERTHCRLRAVPLSPVRYQQAR